MSKDRRKVILVTDGDKIAKQAVERAAGKIGGRCISASAGNPTPISGEKIVHMIKNAHHDPVVVMFDDRGASGEGRGEQALEHVLKHPDLEVMGVLAVASNTASTDGTAVDCCVTGEKEVSGGQVDKEGNIISDQNIVKGDTIDVINRLPSGKKPYVVGIGDLGKMDGRDDPEKGAEITTQAMKTIVQHWQEEQRKVKGE